MSAYILIVEDEESMARFIELELVHEGYQVEKAVDGRSALSMASSRSYDLILLDIMLPGLNGIEVLRRLQRESADPAPVILLTARDAVMDKVAGLDAGAVDYITKPFAIEELLARIRVALKLYRRRADAYHFASSMPGNNTGFPMEANGSPMNGYLQPALRSPDEYIWGDLVLNDPKHLVTYRGEEITLTNREFLMLKTLLMNQDIVLSRDTLLERVCGYDYVGETNVVDVYIRFLRSKIDEVFGVKMIQTVRGVGYVIKAK